MTTSKPKNTAEIYFSDFKANLDNIDIGQIVKVIELLKKKRQQQKTIFFVGNGGSAATASHAVCDLNKTVLGPDSGISSSLRFKTLCLSDNLPSITAIANDLSYDDIFSEQLKNYAATGDLLIVITGSGNSPNILRALETAKDLNVETFGLLGFDGGKAKDLVDHVLLFKSQDYGIVEDAHMMIIHVITRYFKEYNLRNGA